MDSPKSRRQDISAPGSPYAFSTAIKPPGSFSREPTDGHSSLHEIKEGLSPRSPNDTVTSESLGILDLDAIEGNTSDSLHKYNVAIRFAPYKYFNIGVHV